MYKALDFLDEVLAFLAAPHDDQVDALTQALNWFRGNSPVDYRGFRSISREAEEAMRSRSTGSVDRDSWSAQGAAVAQAEDERRNDALSAGSSKMDMVLRKCRAAKHEMESLPSGQL